MQENNLENMVEKQGLLRRAGNKLRQYTSIVMAAAALAGSAGALNACSDETSDCCAQLACEERDDYATNYICSDVDENDPTYKSHLCIKNEKAGEYGEPTNFCCRCISETKDYGL